MRETAEVHSVRRLRTVKSRESRTGKKSVKSAGESRVRKTASIGPKGSFDNSPTAARVKSRVRYAGQKDIIRALPGDK